MLLIIFYSIFSLIEIFCIIKFTKRNKVMAKESIASYISTSAFLLILYIYKINVPKYMIILFLLTITINTFFGRYLNLYNKSKKFDRYLHAFGSFSFTILAYTILIDIFNEDIESKLFSSIIIFSIGMTLGTIFEISEFLSDKLKKTRHQHGLTDTDTDMIYNLIGSVIAAVYLVVFII